MNFTKLILEKVWIVSPRVVGEEENNIFTNRDSHGTEKGNKDTYSGNYRVKLDYKVKNQNCFTVYSKCFK